MSGYALRTLIIALMLAVTGCGPSEDVGPAEKPVGDLGVAKGGTSAAIATCPAEFIDYCGIWDVEFASSNLKEKHMDVNDRFKIDVKSSGSDPNLWLFAGTDLKGRWNGKDMVKLAEITSAGAHDCMAGEVRLTPHAATATAHEWHQVTIRTEVIPSPDFGTEIRLEVCFSPRDNGSPSTACEINGCATDDDDLLHGGRAHAQD